jgi:hypothetical protein
MWWDEDCLFIGPSQVIGDLCVEEEVQELREEGVQEFRSCRI